MREQDGRKIDFSRNLTSFCVWTHPSDTPKKPEFEVAWSGILKVFGLKWRCWAAHGKVFPGFSQFRFGPDCSFNGRGALSGRGRGGCHRAILYET
ncbi:MAG: hypothetical protein OXN21_11335, partial [Chloroflexota bacterium]|nr:hypothetical protein [Chloroflexota bacterium]